MWGMIGGEPLSSTLAEVNGGLQPYRREVMLFDKVFPKCEECDCKRAGQCCDTVKCISACAKPGRRSGCWSPIPLVPGATATPWLTLHML